MRRTLASILVLLGASCQTAPPVSTSAPESNPLDDLPWACPEGHVALATCASSAPGAPGASVCTPSGGGRTRAVELTWRMPGELVRRARLEDAELAALEWSREEGPSHLNSSLGWTHDGAQYTLRLHSSLPTPRWAPRHSGSLSRGAPDPSSLRCTHLEPHELYPLLATAAVRVPWAPGWSDED